MTEPSRAHGAAQRIFRGSLMLADAKLKARDAMMAFDGEGMRAADHTYADAWLNDIHGGVKALLDEIEALEADNAALRHDKPAVPVLRSAPVDLTDWDAFRAGEESLERAATNGRMM